MILVFLTKEERVQILENIISEYEKRFEELAETISKEMGAPIWLSQVAQVASGLTHFKDTLNVLKNYDFEYEKDGYLVRKEPVGIVGMITPWNWPMNQMCTKVASGIAAGCTMVLKPSEIPSSLRNNSCRNYSRRWCTCRSLQFS